MQQIVGFDQIKFRAAKLRLPLPELARKAGVAPSTAYRAEKNPTFRTLKELSEALLREEAAMRRHLAELERSREGRQLDLIDQLKQGRDTR